MSGKEELVDHILKKREAVRLAKAEYYKDHFWEFNKDILGWPDLNPKLHKEICNWVVDNRGKRRLLLIPRGHLKSSIITIAYTLWQIAKNPEVRILISNATYGMATNFLFQIKNVLQKNEAFKELYGDLAKDADNWRESQITVSKEGWRAKEPTVTVYGMGGSLTGQHYNVILLDDLVNRDNISTKDQIDKVIEFYKESLNVLEPDGEMIVVGCLTAGTKVTMADGRLKDIEKIKVGERVLSYNSVETVEAMISQGKDKVFELKTRNHTVEATGNHPFLTKDGFIKLTELKVGQRIKVCRYFSSRLSRGKYTSDDMWVLGFMLGDGWITENPNKKYNSMRLITCFAKGVHENTNKKALNILTNYGRFKETKGGYYRSDNIAVGNYLRGLGFKGKAKTKRVPGYIFSLAAVFRDSFVAGFLAADGYINNTLRCTELANLSLVRDIKHLAESCGYKVSNIHTRTRVLQPPHSPKPIVITTYHISIGNRKKEIKWDWERVVSIKELGKKEVYDLTISNTKNFVAEGMVVHNTRWHQSDLYGWILDPENNILPSFSVYTKKAFDNDWDEGKPIFPEKFSWKHLKQLRREEGPSIFSAQYLNDPVSTEDATFKKEMFHYYIADDIVGKRVNYFTTVDPAISQEKEADFTVIMTIAVDESNNWWVVDIFRDRITPMQLLDQLYFVNNKYRPLMIGIEQVAFQKVLQYFIQEEMKRRNSYLPVQEVKPDHNESKELRIKGLEPRYSAGTVFHSNLVKNIDYLEDELLRFPKGKHDDIIDALSYMNQIAYPPGKRKHNQRRRTTMYSGGIFK